MVEESAKSPPPTFLGKKLAKNNLHVMKRILYDTGPRVYARWSCERILKLSNSALMKMLS